MNDDAPDPAPQKASRDVESWIRPFFEDTDLWPILAVLVLSLCTMGSAVIAMALVAWNPFALAALALALLVSADVAIRGFVKGKNRLIAGCVIGFWLGSAGITALAISLKIF